MDEPRDDGGTGPTLGVLIIGSLFWDNSTRDEWRRDRLDLERRQYVRAPIRYGRQSTGRGCSYTMVFSAGLCEAEFGTAIGLWLAGSAAFVKVLTVVQFWELWHNRWRGDREPECGWESD